MGPYDHVDEWRNKHNRLWSEDALRELESLVAYERNRRNENRERLRTILGGKQAFYCVYGDFMDATMLIEMWVDGQCQPITEELIESDHGAHPVLVGWISENSKVLIDMSDIAWIKDGVIKMHSVNQDRGEE